MLYLYLRALRVQQSVLKEDNGHVTLIFQTLSISNSHAQPNSSMVRALTRHPSKVKLCANDTLDMTSYLGDYSHRIRTISY